METSKYDHYGYKDEKYEKIATEIRNDLYNGVNSMKNRNYSKSQEYFNKVENLSTQLARYLHEKYPNNFNYLIFKYKLEISELGEYSGPLYNAPQDAKDIWNSVIIENNYIPKIHDLILARVNVIRSEKYKIKENYVYFIGDNEEIYVMINNTSNTYAPNEFYEFMQRMGLTDTMRKYIYKGPEDYRPLEYKSWKWPRRIELSEKLI